MKGRRLAIIGARGIGRHGGFESVVSELAPRLSARGYDVYCSTRIRDDDGIDASFGEVTLLRFPLSFPRAYVAGKAFEVLYDTYFVLKCRFSVRCDVIYCLGIASGPALLATKWFGAPSAVNVDGLEWTRDKFGVFAKLFLRMSFLACCIASDRIVLDNKALIAYVPRRYRKKAVHIQYGVSKIDCPALLQSKSLSGIVGRDCICEGEYWLVVARLEPENNIHKIIRGYLSSRSAKPLVIVGDFSSSHYRRHLKKLCGKVGQNKKVIMAGSIYDSELLARLRCGCFAYVHGHSVGGTNPSLLEAMSAGNVIVAHDNVFNREVCSQTALYFSDESSLADVMNRIDDNPSANRGLGGEARKRTERIYRWDDVVAEHEKLFSDIGSA